MAGPRGCRGTNRSLPALSFTWRLCEVRGRSHYVGYGWKFCPAHPQLETDEYINEPRRLFAHIQDTASREEQYWRWMTGAPMEHWRSITGARLDRFPRPCLGSAAALAVPTVVAKLLSGRADPQEVARQHCTALQEALTQHVWDRPLEAVAECEQLLVQHKADLNSKDAADRTPLD